MEKPAFLKPSSTEVVDAVKSLYADQLKPFGRILLKRIRERRAAAVAAATGDREAVIDPDALPLIDPKCLRSVCSACKSLCVQPEDGKEYSVLLVGWPSTFVDVCSARDPYPAELWGGAASYFESLDGNEILLPGGRYACAQELVSRSLTFLQARSLGEVCHIVQLAVSQKRILGYLDGSMVPYGRSVEWVKEQCAVRQQPVCTTKRAESTIPCATWEQARACLREILDNTAGPGPGVITLSNVKRLFRSQYNLELSETVLGHSKLCDLLQDPRFQDVCSVQLQGKSQVVVQRVEPLAIGSSPFCPTAAWQFDDGVMSAEFGATSEELSAWDSAPWEAGSDYMCLSTVPHDLPPWSSPPVPLVDDDTHANGTVEAAAGGDGDADSALSTYVLQLLALEESQGHVALPEPSEYADKMSVVKADPAQPGAQLSCASASTASGAASDNDSDGSHVDARKAALLYLDAVPPGDESFFATGLSVLGTV